MQTATDQLPITVTLTPAQARLLSGLVSSYQLELLHDLKKGALTETGIRNYRNDLAAAGEIVVALGGGL